MSINTEGRLIFLYKSHIAVDPNRGSTVRRTVKYGVVDKQNQDKFSVDSCLYSKLLHSHRKLDLRKFRWCSHEDECGADYTKKRNSSTKIPHLAMQVMS